MNRKQSASYVWVVAAVVGFVFLASQLKTFDTGTMNTPHVISLHK